MHNRVQWTYNYPVGHNGPPTDATMPVWKMPVSKSHKDADGGGPSKAGYPDFVLYYAPAKGKHSAIAEIKTFWSYKIQEVINIFRQGILTNDRRGHAEFPELPVHLEIPGEDGGYFDWRNTLDSADIVKQVSLEITSNCDILLKTCHQIWGEVEAFKVRWGVWTNGKIILAFVRTGTYNVNIPGSANQLTFSKIMNINAPNVIHLGFLGLCFASLDEKEDMVANLPVQDLVQVLCPEGDRLNPLTQDWSAVNL